MLKNQKVSNEDLLTLKENMYIEYCGFLDHIIVLKNKGNMLDNIRIMFNKEISEQIPLIKSNIEIIKNYEVTLNYIFRENLSIKKSFSLTKSKIEYLIKKLAGITKFIETKKLYPSHDAIEIEYILNLIFRYLTLLQG